MAETLKPDLQVTRLNRVVGKEAIDWGIESLDSLMLQAGGIAGDRHFGPTRTMPGWDTKELKGRAVANDRQLSIVSDSEIRAIAEEMDLPIDLIEERSETTVEYFISHMLAANIALKGLAVSVHMQPNSTLIFESGGAVRVSERNLPCKKPAAKIKRTLDGLDIEYANGDFGTIKKQFKEAANIRRGWLGFVFSTGEVAVGDQVVVRPPLASPNI